MITMLNHVFVPLSFLYKSLKHSQKKILWKCRYYVMRLSFRSRVVVLRRRRFQYKVLRINWNCTRNKKTLHIERVLFTDINQYRNKTWANMYEASMDLIVRLSVFVIVYRTPRIHIHYRVFVWWIHSMLV